MRGNLLPIVAFALIATGAAAHGDCGPITCSSVDGMLVCANEPPPATHPAPVVAPPSAVDWCHIRPNGEIFCDGDASLGMRQ